MKINISLYEKSMPDSLSWEEKLLAAKRAGFDAIEMSVDESDSRLSRLEWSREERADLLALTRKIGCHINSICLSGQRKYPMGSGIPTIEMRSMEIMEKAIALAYDLGVSILQLAGYDVYYEEPSTAETKARFLRNLKKSTELAASKGVILALETMENDFLNTVQKGMEFVNAIHSPYLQMYPDVGNITNAVEPEGVIADLLQGQGHIVAAHLKETVPNVFRNMKFGTGRVDFATLVSALKAQGVTWFTAEFWYDGTDTWEQTLQETFDFLLRVV